MARWKWVGLMMLAGTLPAHAALQAHYQRQVELEAIIDYVLEAFMTEGQVIDSIVMKGPDFYEVSGGPCLMEVAIVDVPHEPGAEVMVGPRQFAVESGPIVCD